MVIQYNFKIDSLEYGLSYVKKILHLYTDFIHAYFHSMLNAQARDHHLSFSSHSIIVSNLSQWGFYVKNISVILDILIHKNCISFIIKYEMYVLSEFFEIVSEQKNVWINICWVECTEDQQYR